MSNDSNYTTNTLKFAKSIKQILNRIGPYIMCAFIGKGSMLSVLNRGIQAKIGGKV